MSHTITSTTISAGYTLTNTVNSPLVVTSTGKVSKASGPAVYASAGAGNHWTVDNSGLIIGGNASVAGSGIYMGGFPVASSVASGVVINRAGGTISGTEYGIRINGVGTITNDAGAVISSAGNVAAYLYGHPGTVINYGIISDTGNDGVYATDGAVILNKAGGTISGGSTVSSGYGIMLGGIGTVENAGVISKPLNDAVDFSDPSPSDRLIVDPGASFIGKINGGTGVLELKSGASTGTLAGFGSSITNFGTLTFDSGADWTAVGAGSTTSSGFGTMAINGFAAGDTIDVAGFVATSRTFTSNALILTNAASAHTTLAIQGTFTTSDFQIVSDGVNGTDITLLCFCAGTLITTPEGATLVEELAAGDLVLTASGQARAITWIGIGRHIVNRGKRCGATPVIVSKGALGDSVPYRDLRVTKGHAFLVDGVLIPVEFLINHRSIRWDDRAQGVEIYHIELETHDVLLANGAPAESYRDDGNRHLFQNAQAGSGERQPPCAPVLDGGAEIDAIWRRLLDRSGPRGSVPLTEDPDVHLLVDGRRLDATQRNGSFLVFALPECRGIVRIASRAAAPQELGIANDPRCLGVACRRILARRGARSVRMAADDKRLAEGFHQYEPTGDLRWTDGDATMPDALFSGLYGAIELVLEVGCTSRYVDDGKRRRIA